MAASLLPSRKDRNTIPRVALTPAVRAGGGRVKQISFEQFVGRSIAACDDLGPSRSCSTEMPIVRDSRKPLFMPSNRYPLGLGDAPETSRWRGDSIDLQLKVIEEAT